MSIYVHICVHCTYTEFLMQFIHIVNKVRCGIKIMTNAKSVLQCTLCRTEIYIDKTQAFNSAFIRFFILACRWMGE